MAKPKLIVFEGIEYTGKSTLVEHTKKQLEQLGYRVATYGSPNNFLPMGKLIRKHILSVDTDTGMTETVIGFAMMGALRELAQYIIRQHLVDDAPEKVDFILLDRWAYTTMVYNNTETEERVIDTDVLGEAWTGAFENLISATKANLSDFDNDSGETQEFFMSPSMVVWLRGAEVAHRRASEADRAEVHHNDRKSLEQFKTWEDRYETLWQEVNYSASFARLLEIEIGNRIEDLVTTVMQDLADQNLILRDTQ